MKIEYRQPYWIKFEWDIKEHPDDQYVTEFNKHNNNEFTNILYNISIVSMNRNFLQTNVVAVAIILFLIFYGVVQYMKPAFLYNTDGSLRVFGVGYRNKTILPMWLFSLVLAILCYLAVLYYLEFQQYV